MFVWICELSDGTAASDDTLAVVIDFCSASRAPIPVDDKGMFSLFGLTTAGPKSAEALGIDRAAKCPINYKRLQ
jgi:hypothetical protein